MASLREVTTRDEWGVDAEAVAAVVGTFFAKNRWSNNTMLVHDEVWMGCGWFW